MSVEESAGGTAPSLLPSPQRIGRPSAFGGGWRRFWHLLWMSAVAEFQIQYVGSVLGYVWTVLRPLALFAVLYAFITEIAFQFADEVPDYAMFLLLNIVLFQFFAEATIVALRSLTSRAALVRKMPMPRLVMPLSSVLSVLFTLGTNLIVVMVWIVLYGIEPRWSWLLLAVVLLLLLLFTVGCSLLVSALFVRFRDVGQVWPIVTRVLFYGSPVLWPIELFPDGFVSDVQSYNPLAPLFAQARVWVIDPAAQGWFEGGRSTLEQLLPFVIMVAVCLAGVLVFARFAHRAAEAI